jgi:hypothetical protein
MWQIPKFLYEIDLYEVEEIKEIELIWNWSFFCEHYQWSLQGKIFFSKSVILMDK